MKEPYLAVEGQAQKETPLAFCLRNPETVIDGIVHRFAGDLWIPKANIHEDSHDTIDEAERDEAVEIFVAKWWLKESM